MNHVDPNLRRELFGWYSHRLGMDMPIVRYGHWGPALLLFPTAGGDFLEAERMGLIQAVAPHLFAGRVQLFSINSINPLAWMNASLPGWEKARNQRLYSEYVEQEVVPHIRRCLQDEHARLGVTGASFGAFHAANTFFRRPDLFCALLALGGFYDIQRPEFLQDGFWSDDVYFNNPVSYVPNLPEGEALDLLRHHSQIHLLTSRGAWEDPSLTERLSHLLHQRGIPHNLDIWGHDMPHDWPTWYKQLDHYLGERLGL
jgi:esterase/lipase superfamily enzyme